MKIVTLKFSIQKKVILFFLLFSLFLVLAFFLKIDWLKKSAFLEILNKNLIQKVNKTLQILAQEYPLYFFPHYPQRLIYLLGEINLLTEELAELNEELNNKLKESDCKFALSECLPKIIFDKGNCQPDRVLGGPYPDQSINEIEEKKEKIADRIDNLSFLRELLKKEMETSLPKELETLRVEVAEELKNNLDNVLEKSEKIISAAKEARNLYSQDYTKKCIASCKSGPVYGIEACARVGSGPQRQINIKTKLGVSLDDLELGKVETDKFGLALPDKLQFPQLGDITLTFPSQTLSVCFPLQPVTVSVDSPSFATFPTLSFNCPTLELKDISPSYQCGQTAGDKEVKTGADSNWHFKTLSYLMESCAALPTMSDNLGLKEKAENCYKPDKVVETINNECDILWQNYCFSWWWGVSPSSPPLPAICQKTKYSCFKKGTLNRAIVLDGNLAAAKQCQNLFNQEKLPIPYQCSYIQANYYDYDDYRCPNPAYPTLKGNLCLSKNFNPVLTLKDKCRELKDKYPEEPPEPCKLLPLFAGQIEAPGSENYSTLSTKCPAQKLLNLPFGFGGGFGFNCPISLPNLLNLPKIVLPDIIIPDIILPEFRIPPFLKIKLPKIITEDLILPDVELCDLNNCSDIFASLYFNLQLPQLRLPSLDLSIATPGLPGLDLRTRIDFPEINFPLPQINLFNLLLPELKLPEIKTPSPKINFSITGIDVGAIFDLISTFILNAMDVPDTGGCLKFKIQPPSLDIVFPDYYFSFIKFPEIPKIPFCQDINQYCQKVKNALGDDGWLKKVEEIETEFNKTIYKIQKELDKVSEAVTDAQNIIEEVFKDVYSRAIYDAVTKQLVKSGLSLEDYINPKTKEIDLSKVPFPGVFPVKITEERECLPVSIPQVDILLRIVDKTKYPKKKIERDLSSPPFQYIIYVPVDISPEIPIPWPKKLKEINLINPLTYELPKIPLSNLNYEKEFEIKGPGFQPRTFSFNIGQVNEGDCLAEPPKGGNPFPISEITNKINEIKDFKAEIDNSSQKIIKILE